MTKISLNSNLEKLADYLIINGGSKNTSGLYYGKAGDSIILFEVARILNNSWIDNHAFDLLNQALLSKNKSTDFSTGLSGITYALNYAVKREFIEADLDELFSEQINIICKDFISEEKDLSNLLLKLVNWVYVLCNIQSECITLKMHKIALQHWQRIFQEITTLIIMAKDGVAINNYELKCQWQILHQLSEKGTIKGIFPEEIAPLRENSNRIVYELYTDGIWASERILTPFDFREQTANLYPKSKDNDYEQMIKNHKHSIKPTLFDGVGRWTLLELLRYRQSEQITELLSLPNLSSIYNNFHIIYE